MCGSVYQQCELEVNEAPSGRGMSMSRCSSRTDGVFPATCTFQIMFSRVISIREQCNICVLFPDQQTALSSDCVHRTSGGEV